MIDSDKMTEYFNSVILLLYLPENRNKEIGYDDLVKGMALPDEYQRPLWNKLWNAPKRFVDGQPSLRNPQIKLSEYGKKYAESIDDEFFSKAGFSLIDKPVIQPLAMSCEMIFNRILENGGSLIISKQTFNPLPKNLFDAIEVLVQSEMLIKSTTDSRKLIVSTDFLRARNYKHAKRLLADKKKKHHWLQYAGWVVAGILGVLNIWQIIRK